MGRRHNIFHKNKRYQRIMASLVLSVLGITLLAQPVLADVNIDYTENDVQTYDPTGTASACSSPYAGSGSSGGSGSGASKLDGYSLPASSGRTGDEEPINAAGQVPSTGNRVTFWQFAKLGAPYRDYYITMRWNYVAWNWNGTATGVDGQELQWMQNRQPDKNGPVLPRLVIVTNTRNGKSIIAAALESGPAPWTGVDTQPNNNPKQGWFNPERGTPGEYKGRVSGLPPKAIAALDAKQGMSDGSGDILNYSWVPDQDTNAKDVPGPTTASADSSNCTGNGNGFVTTDGYSFPIGLAKNIVANNHGYTWPCPYPCHHDGTPAADLSHREVVAGTAPDSKVVGTPVYAITAGTIKYLGFYDNTGCYMTQLVGQDGWWYWYGHIDHPIVQNGQKLKAGQQIAVVGERKCTGNGSYPHLHIDRGAHGANQFPGPEPLGGYPCCRDPGFVDLINRLWASLP